MEGGVAMAVPRSPVPAEAARHRTLFEDPVRFACLAATGALVFMPEVPFLLTLFVVAVLQMAPVAMVAGAAAPGWSRRWGRPAREGVAVSGLATDFANLSACTVAGGLLLVRHFNGVEVVRPLGILAAGICLLPDIRLCRWLLSGDPAERSRQLREGWCFRDPAALGALLAAAVACLLDPVSLFFAMLSMAFLQTNTLLVFVDKHLSEIEPRRFPGWKGLFLEREGRRLASCLGALALVPLRAGLGDRAAFYGAAVLAAFIVVPDLVRAAWRGLKALGGLLRLTPVPVSPATIVVLPRS
jgi:hypothetical protein